MLIFRKEVVAVLFAPIERGQGLVEYALIIVLVILIVIIVLALVGTRITQNLYSKIVSALPGGKPAWMAKKRDTEEGVPLFCEIVPGHTTRNY